MKAQNYVALLRGINVGGNNIIKMVSLKSCFEKLGFDNVVTYIQSGNVLFEVAEKNADTLTKKIEAALTKQFSYQSRVVVVSRSQLKTAVHGAPKGFGSKPGLYRYDVIFLKPPMTVREAMKQVRIREGADQASAGKNVLYFSRLISKASQSHLSKIIKQPAYQLMTIRNWNTTTKLVELMEKYLKESK